MIKIGICDEDPVFSNRLYNIINNVMLSFSDWKASFYHSGKEIISAIESNDFDCQLVFMDLMMSNGDGLKTAQYIYEHQVDTDLIFITASAEHVFECYHYHTFAYLLKPISESDISLELQRYLRELTISPNYLTISAYGVNHQIPIHSILYIESNRRKLTIHTRQNNYECYLKLDDMEERLKNDGFVRCHQSYLVSVNQITDYTNNQLCIQNIKIPVSRKYQSDIKKIFSALAEYPQTSSHPTSLGEAQKEYGALVCTRGAYLGSIIRFRPEQKILIGRDGNMVDMVVNLPFVSRLHCSILYHHDTILK